MPEMRVALALCAVIAAAFATRAHYLEGARQRWQVYLFKPLATLLVLALAMSAAPLPPARYHWAIAAGLLFSTAGDIFLMLPRDRFVAGLASFLFAHLCYLAAFTSDAGFGAGLVLWLPFFAAGGAVVALVWPGLRPALRGPVAAYVVVIAAMAGQAAGRWSVVGNDAALLAAAGAGLFVVSDATLAIDRFRRPFRAARAVTLATYWAAQLLIALSVPR